MATDRTQPGTKTPTSTETKIPEPAGREANLVTLGSLIGRVEVATAKTNTSATGISFDLEPGKSQWVLSVHTGLLQDSAPYTKTLTALLIRKDSSGHRIAESITANLTHSFGKDGITGIRHTEANPSHPTSWDERIGIGRLEDIINAYIPLPTDTTSLTPDDADGQSTEPQIPDYPAKAYRAPEGHVVIEIPGIPSADGDGSFTPVEHPTSQVSSKEDLDTHTKLKNGGFGYLDEHP